MKRISKIIFIIMILLLTFSMVGCLYSVANEEGKQEKSGTELDDAYAMICFYNYITSGSGRYLAYKLIYDYSYYQKKKSTLKNLLDDLGESFERNGYTVNINDYSGEMTASLSFDSTENYLRATDYDGFAITENSYDSINKTPFYVDYTIKSTTLFTDIDKDYKFIGRIYSIGCVKAGISSEDVILSYVFGTPNKETRLCTNADSVKYSAENNLYLHIFYMSVNDCDRVIEITQHTPNTPVWYAIAIAGGIVVFAVPFIIYLSQRKKKE